MLGLNVGARVPARAPAESGCRNITPARTRTQNSVALPHARGRARLHLPRLFLIPLVLAFGAAFCGQAAAQTPNQAKKPARAARPDFQISGITVNALTGEPVPHAEISLGFSEKPAVLHSTFSEAGGHFSFHGLSSAKYWLSARGRGFTAQGLDEHEGFFTGIAVGPGKDSQNIIFRLRPDSSIIGMISDNENEPVAGAQVMLFHGGVEGGRSNTYLLQQTASDDQGHYRFPHLPSGTYFIAVSARPWYAQTPEQGMSAYVKGGIGAPAEDPSTTPPAAVSTLDVAYPLTFYPGVTDAAGASAIDLQPGDQTSADVSLTAVPAVHLRISGASHEGQLNGVSLMQTFGSAVLPVAAQTGQAPDGEFELSGMPPGEYVLTMNSGGKAGTWARTVDVAGDTELDASESPVATRVTGTVRLNGHPAGDANVRLRNHASGRTLDERTSEKGDFDFDQSGLGPGLYEVSVFNVADAALSGIAATGAAVQGHSVQISGPGAVHLNLTMSQNLARIEGVALRDGKPAAGMMVVLVPQKLEDNVPLVRRDQSDSDGTFALVSVLPGKYTVVAIANGWSLQWMNPAVLQPYLKAGTPVEVGSGRKYAVNVKVQ